MRKIIFLTLQGKTYTKILASALSLLLCLQLPVPLFAAAYQGPAEEESTSMPEPPPITVGPFSADDEHTNPSPPESLYPEDFDFGSWMGQQQGPLSTTQNQAWDETIGTTGGEEVQTATDGMSPTAEEWMDTDEDSDENQATTITYSQPEMSAGGFAGFKNGNSVIAPAELANSVALPQPTQADIPTHLIIGDPEGQHSPIQNIRVEGSNVVITTAVRTYTISLPEVGEQVGIFETYRPNGYQGFYMGSAAVFYLRNDGTQVGFVGQNGQTLFTLAVPVLPQVVPPASVGDGSAGPPTTVNQQKLQPEAEEDEDGAGEARETAPEPSDATQPTQSSGMPGSVPNPSELEEADEDAEAEGEPVDPQPASDRSNLPSNANTPPPGDNTSPSAADPASNASAFTGIGKVLASLAASLLWNSSTADIPTDTSGVMMGTLTGLLNTVQGFLQQLGGVIAEDLRNSIQQFLDSVSASLNPIMENPSTLPSYLGPLVQLAHHLWNLLTSSPEPLQTESTPASARPTTPSQSVTVPVPRPTEENVEDDLEDWDNLADDPAPPETALLPTRSEIPYDDSQEEESEEEEEDQNWDDTYDEEDLSGILVNFDVWVEETPRETAPAPLPPLENIPQAIEAAVVLLAQVLMKRGEMDGDMRSRLAAIQDVSDWAAALGVEDTDSGRFRLETLLNQIRYFSEEADFEANTTNNPFDNPLTSIGAPHTPSSHQTIMNTLADKLQQIRAIEAEIQAKLAQLRQAWLDRVALNPFNSSESIESRLEGEIRVLEAQRTAKIQEIWPAVSAQIQQLINGADLFQPNYINDSTLAYRNSFLRLVANFLQVLSTGSSGSQPGYEEVQAFRKVILGAVNTSLDSPPVPLPIAEARLLLSMVDTALAILPPGMSSPPQTIFTNFALPLGSGGYGANLTGTLILPQGQRPIGSYWTIAGAPFEFFTLDGERDIYHTCNAQASCVTQIIGANGETETRSMDSQRRLVRELVIPVTGSENPLYVLYRGDGTIAVGVLEGSQPRLLIERSEQGWQINPNLLRTAGSDRARIAGFLAEAIVANAYPISEQFPNEASREDLKTAITNFLLDLTHPAPEGFTRTRNARIIIKPDGKWEVLDEIERTFNIAYRADGTIIPPGSAEREVRRANETRWVFRLRGAQVAPATHGSGQSLHVMEPAFFDINSGAQGAAQLGPPVDPVNGVALGQPGAAPSPFYGLLPESEYLSNGEKLVYSLRVNTIPGNFLARDDRQIVVTVDLHRRPSGQPTGAYGRAQTARTVASPPIPVAGTSGLASFSAWLSDTWPGQAMGWVTHNIGQRVLVNGFYGGATGFLGMAASGSTGARLWMESVIRYFRLAHGTSNRELAGRLVDGDRSVMMYGQYLGFDELRELDIAVREARLKSLQAEFAARYGVDLAGKSDTALQRILGANYAAYQTRVVSLMNAPVSRDERINYVLNGSLITFGSGLATAAAETSGFWGGIFGTASVVGSVFDMLLETGPVLGAAGLLGMAPSVLTRFSLLAGRVALLGHLGLSGFMMGSMGTGLAVNILDLVTLPAGSAEWYTALGQASGNIVFLSQIALSHHAARAQVRAQIREIRRVAVQKTVELMQVRTEIERLRQKQRRTPQEETKLQELAAWEEVLATQIAGVPPSILSLLPETFRNEINRATGAAGAPPFSWSALFGEIGRAVHRQVARIANGETLFSGWGVLKFIGDMSTAIGTAVGNFFRRTGPSSGSGPEASSAQLTVAGGGPAAAAPNSVRAPSFSLPSSGRVRVRPAAHQAFEITVQTPSGPRIFQLRRGENGEWVIRRPNGSDVLCIRDLIRVTDRIVNNLYDTLLEIQFLENGRIEFRNVGGSSSAPIQVIVPVPSGRLVRAPRPLPGETYEVRIGNTRHTISNQDGMLTLDGMPLAASDFIQVGSERVRIRVDDSGIHFRNQSGQEIILSRRGAPPADTTLPLQPDSESSSDPANFDNSDLTGGERSLPRTSPLPSSGTAFPDIPLGLPALSQRVSLSGSTPVPPAGQVVVAAYRGRSIRVAIDGQYYNLNLNPEQGRFTVTSQQGLHPRMAHGNQIQIGPLTIEIYGNNNTGFRFVFRRTGGSENISFNGVEDVSSPYSPTPSTDGQAPVGGNAVVPPAVSERPGAGRSEGLQAEQSFSGQGTSQNPNIPLPPSDTPIPVPPELVLNLANRPPVPTHQTPHSNDQAPQPPPQPAGTYQRDGQVAPPAPSPVPNPTSDGPVIMHRPGAPRRTGSLNVEWLKGLADATTAFGNWIAGRFGRRPPSTRPPEITNREVLSPQYLAQLMQTLNEGETGPVETLTLVDANGTRRVFSVEYRRMLNSISVNISETPESLQAVRGTFPPEVVDNYLIVTYSPAQRSLSVDVVRFEGDRGPSRASAFEPLRANRAQGYLGAFAYFMRLLTPGVDVIRSSVANRTTVTIINDFLGTNPENPQPPQFPQFLVQRAGESDLIGLVPHSVFAGGSPLVRARGSEFINYAVWSPIGLARLFSFRVPKTIAELLNVPLTGESAVRTIAGIEQYANSVQNTNPGLAYALRLEAAYRRLQAGMLEGNQLPESIRSQNPLMLDGPSPRPSASPQRGASLAPEAGPNPSAGHSAVLAMAPVPGAPVAEPASRSELVMEPQALPFVSPTAASIPSTAVADSRAEVRDAQPSPSSRFTAEEAGTTEAGEAASQPASPLMADLRTYLPQGTNAANEAGTVPEISPLVFSSSPFTQADGNDVQQLTSAGYQEATSEAARPGVPSGVPSFFSAGGTSSMNFSNRMMSGYQDAVQQMLAGAYAVNDPFLAEDSDSSTGPRLRLRTSENAAS